MSKKYICFLSFLAIFIINSYCQINDIIDYSINSYSNNELQRFYSNEYENKNSGIVFTMNFPSNYMSKDGVRPHILKQYTSQQDSKGGIINSNIQITPLPKDITFFSELEIADYMFSEELTQESLPDAKIIFSKRTKYEGQQGQLVIYIQKAERAGLTLNILSCVQRFIYKNCVVTINTFYTLIKPNDEDLEKKLQTFLLLNSQIGNSIVLMKY